MTARAIAAGTSSGSGVRTGSFDVSEITFPAGRRLGWHEHPRACVAVVVDGIVQKRFARGGGEFGFGVVVAMPSLEPHEDVFGRQGARLVVVEADDGVRTVSCFRDWSATLTAFRIARELAAPDAFTPLALEGLALELTALVARGPAAPRQAPWLEQARELLHERCLEAPSAAELATEVGIHPSHLARAFRAAYGDSLGGYARRLRLEWAAVQLVRSDEPLAYLATKAGFVDQSHFTRAFRRHFGLTPARYRGAHR
jgi:AraC family transcriptional regulator